MIFGKSSEGSMYSCFWDTKVSTAEPLEPLTNTSRCTLTWVSERADWSDTGARELGVRADVCQVSSWVLGRMRPNRTMIRQKEIPTTGLVCGRFDEVNDANVRTEGERTIAWDVYLRLLLAR